MNTSDFYRLKKQLDEEILNRLECGDPYRLGLLMDYQNNQGERKQFRVINITSSSFNGCFEADCFSDFQFNRLEELAGYSDEDMAITSHRTFKIANIISAKIC
ncbi:MAG: hypothetical protein IJK42_02155 [Prevotella sp.]|nr:hypothetical protein [Prevotella sp.]MBQ6208564.1 hypothetical protein [Prevotella sp.]